MSFIETILGYKVVKDIAKKLITWDNAKWLARQYNKYIVDRAQHFHDYKVKMQTKFETVNKSVLGNNALKLKDVFVPQYLVEENGMTEIRIEGYPTKIMRQHRRIIIKDYAGRGKSTLMRQMFYDSCEQGKFPLFVQLRDLNDGGTLLEQILDSLHEINEEFDEKLLKYLLRHEDFIFFMDGFDELNADRRGDVAKYIRDMVDDSQKSYFILTSRNDDALGSFGDFKGYSLKDFTLDQACELILKYDNTNRGKGLVKELQDGKHSEVAEFLKSPLHTTLFYKVFIDKQGVPYKLHEVCEEILQSLYTLHDLSKDGEYEHQKKCNLSLTDYKRVLGYIAFHCLKNNQLSIPRTDLPQLLSAVRAYCPDLSFTDDDMEYDMTVALSLFKERVTEIAWIHECMCHFFAACYVRMDRNSKRSELFGKFYKSGNLKNYVSMLKQYSEIEPIEFRKYLLTLLLKDMVADYSQRKNSARPGLTSESIEARSYLLFKSDVLCERADGGLQFQCTMKDRAFMLDILYGYFKENYGQMPVIDVEPEDMDNKRMTKHKMTVNSWSESQPCYDYANSKVAEQVVDEYHYLPISVVSDIMTELNKGELLSEDSDLLRNI